MRRVSTANAEIRTMIKATNLFCYEVAAELNVTEGTLHTWLRTEMPEEKKGRVIKAVIVAAGKLME